MAASSFLRCWLLRPSLWTCLISIIAYWDKTALHGAFVYDDAGSIRNNIVVNGQKPWTEVFTRDFWGTPMKDVQSHKSFRPITTLTFKWNWILSEKLGGTNNNTTTNTKSSSTDPTYGFHLVNVGLHGIVTGLVTEAAAYVFNSGSQDDWIAQLITGFIFGLHPVHAEAVSNLTSRGELLMSLFFLLAFVSFASHVSTTVKRNTQSWSSFAAIYIIPWICMTLSLFCKEQGATALISLVVYDFVHHHVSFKDYLIALRQRDQASIAFLRRTLILAVETVIVCLWRYWLNGETSPDFIYDQNPAGFSEDHFTRIMSTNWVYCLYVFDALFPKYLCPDWSGVSIDLIETWTDPRIPFILALWVFTAACLFSLFVGLPKQADERYWNEIRRVILVAFFAFLCAPFLLSSNLLVVVGLMKADRVIYLPLMGFCVVEALLFKTLCGGASQKSNSDRRSQAYWMGYLLIMTQLMLFCAKIHERNVAWSHNLNLWVSAYKINPRGHHTIYNCGYELSLKKRYDESEYVLREIANPTIDGASNTFVYVMVLYNLNRCNEAHQYLDEAFDVLDQKRKRGGVRDNPKSIARIESNLLVAKAFCTIKTDFQQAGRLMYKAVETDTTNQYAVEQAQALAEGIERAKQMTLEQQQRKLGLR